MSGHSKWNNIKQRKEKTDAEKSKYFSKLSREISVAVKLGGSDISTNYRLKTAIAKAKQYNMPTDKINAVIKKNASMDDTQYFEQTYEGYGVGGVAVVVNCLTDNKNRTSSDVRSNFDKYGGSLGSTGCVSYMFDKRGIIEIEKNNSFNSDKAIELAVELDAIDFEDDDFFTILCEPIKVDVIESAFVKAGFNVLNSEVRLIPQNYVTLNEKQLETFNKMIEKLDSLDDVQDIIHNLLEI